jgi:hypothetical protein
MNTLYPIIRRVRRALLPPEDVAPVVAPVVVQSPTMVPSIETLAESAPVGAVEPAPVVVVATADQSLLTSAATKATKGKREAAKSRVKAIDEAHSDQP